MVDQMQESRRGGSGVFRRGRTCARARGGEGSAQPFACVTSWPVICALVFDMDGEPGGGVHVCYPVVEILPGLAD